MYLDNAATTSVRREVLDAMAPFLTTEFGNPSSAHELGRAARDALERARGSVAARLGMRRGDVVFTSGGTEANNLAVKGIALAALADRGAKHLVTTPIEHSSVLASVRFLERVHGFSVSLLPVDAHGSVRPEDLSRALRDDTALASVQLANNEIGTVQDTRALADVCRARRVPLHVDAVQAAGWLPLDDLGADAVSISGHKIGAPTGMGALAVRGRIPLEPLLHGGGQERGRRSGTESVAGAVAVATALALAERAREADVARVSRLRDAFVADVLRLVPGARVTGHPRSRLPHIASFVVPGVNGEALLVELERAGVVASSGSACAAGRTDPSHVLLATHEDADTARTALRFSLAHDHDADLAGVASVLAEAVDRVGM
ncbi:cysteine desulfurase family protein [Microbacterium sp. G2-8]|uniref:cysteine desulfurase family protein n=1 Tax=Microbacterium sp. G2-8 TaxID=2842454 RepID=UPI001C89FB52|nr:cysteine desulfurase family protein [Microbacterium sp. G2-8]